MKKSGSFVVRRIFIYAYNLHSRIFRPVSSGVFPSFMDRFTSQPVVTGHFYIQAVVIPLYSHETKTTLYAERLYLSANVPRCLSLTTGAACITGYWVKIERKTPKGLNVERHDIPLKKIRKGRSSEVSVGCSVTLNVSNDGAPQMQHKSLAMFNN